MLSLKCTSTSALPKFSCRSDSSGAPLTSGENVLSFIGSMRP